ncbi:MAG: AMP-binding protein [Parachlamydiaceae bacterium]|nr:AMP-binding protein [Parachlamydiaceae bacterium]
MRRIVEFFLAFFMRVILWFRYRVIYKGLDNLNKDTLSKPGGVLFLPSHPAVFVDPLVVTLGAMKKYKIRPLVVEYMYYAPVVHTVCKFLDALAVPQISSTSNSLKRRKTEKVMKTVAESLRQGQNFLIYPAGKVKLSEIEVIGGASGVHEIIHEVPEVNVVLVRVKGLWGSSFSSYHDGKALPLFATITQGIKFCFKNLLFFTPRREVIVEFVPAPADFPYQGTRMEINQYLEKWYNLPDGMTKQQGDYPGDSLMLVSYSMWGEKYLERHKEKNTDDDVNLSEIPDKVKEKVIAKIAALANKEPKEITLNQNLAMDLGLDSLDIAELSGFLLDDFEARGIPVNELTTVSRVMAIAAKQVTLKVEIEDNVNISKWKKVVQRERVEVGPGETMAEVFLNTSQRLSSSIACGDLRSGILTYKQVRMRAILLAEYISKLPGKYIGILLPASVAANVVVMAVQIAGRIPLMVNWTAGSRHLESVIHLSDVKVILSSWAFLDKLEHVDLEPVEDSLVMLEDVGRDLTLWDKMKAAFRARRSTKSILSVFNSTLPKKEDPAVLLFTSGTENLPKGVPLSNNNILSQLRAVSDFIDVYSDDVLFAFLPPFHAFGFTISTLFPMLAGIKVASSPDPTDSKRLAHGMEKWGATMICGAPTFLRGLFKMATPEQVSTLRLCVTGAEKAPPELFKLLKSFGKLDTLIEGYGITECSPVLTVNPLVGLHKGVGLPLPGIELSIVHPDTHEKVDDGTPGLILARGSNIFSGYINADVASPFVKHAGKSWYSTGDLGYLDEDGYLMISGRQKRFIKIGGEMISLASIEDALLNDESIHQITSLNDSPPLAICAKEVEGDRTKIVLFFCHSMALESVNKILKKSGFSNLVRISSIVELDELPLMGSGKINYRALETEYLSKEQS